VADEPEADRIRLDFHKWTTFASSIEKFQHDATGGRGREPEGDTRGPVARTHIAAARLHHWSGRVLPASDVRGGTKSQNPRRAWERLK
jgi:hypothetical protein